MNRRHFLAAAGTVTAVAAASRSVAAEADHAHHHHGASPNTMLIMSSAHCIMTGEACLQHCLDSFIGGDTTLAVCAKKVTDLITICRSLQGLAIANSPYLIAQSKIALAVCIDCEKECRKHEKHATCKACADACLECAAECRKLAA
jgi:Cys-rich four helix bundle protein (predicted Tat secretion target)